MDRLRGFMIFRRWATTVFAVVAFALVAQISADAIGRAAGEPIPAGSHAITGARAENEPALQPRTPATKPKTIKIPARGVRKDIVIVKMAEGSEIRLQGSDFLSLQTSPSDPFGSSLLRLNETVHRPIVRQIRRHFTESEIQLDEEKRTGERRSGKQLADLNLYYEIQLNSGTDPAPPLKALNSLPIVELAYLEPVPEPAAIPSPSAVGAPSTPDYESRQNCLADTSTGVHALYGWAQPGGAGAGVKIVDVEGGWQDTHEEFPAPFAPIDGTNSTDPLWRQHGTAVLGELIGEDNGAGVTGIAHDAQFGAVSIFGHSTSNAITRASSLLSAGDVIVVELHAPGPASGLTCSCNCSQFEYVPMEYWIDVYDAIRTATANGRIVIEAAGNGSMDLDNPIYSGAFDRSQRDSGAILVGAGVSTNRTPHCWTNYGSRVDLQGWGNNVVTTGYGDLFNGTQDGGTDDPDRYYTAIFNGTSSATPIVAGSAAAIQGRYRAVMGGEVLNPGILRELIRNTGTTQGTSGTYGNRQIGPLPNIEAAMNALKSDAPPPPENLAAIPTSWSKTNAFEIDWTNPPHSSAIAGAYYRIGSPPTSDTDGAFTTAKPFSVTATAQGGEPIYVWLKDANGNLSYVYRSATTLSWDATPPFSEITNPTPDPTYTTMGNTIDLSGNALDGFSGIAEVTWSNDRGASGTADGTFSWFVPNIPLSIGLNVITVTARDGAGNTAADSLDVTREVPDTVPNPFAFSSKTGVARATAVESEIVTIGGINTPAAISISGGGGQYRINGGAYTSAAGTVTAGQSVQVRVISSPSYYTTTTTTLTIGGVGAVFSVTTLAAPFDFSISAQSATVTAGATVSSSIAATLVSGAAASVTFSSPSLAGTTFSWSSGSSCTPTCTRTLDIATSPTTPVGASTVILTADGGGLHRTASFVLTVNPPSCVIPPTGLLSWWPGDGNANDIIGGDTGTPQGGATFAQGMVGSAFQFDGVDGRVVIPYRPDLNPVQSVTIVAWFKGAPTGTAQSLISRFNHNSGPPGDPTDDSYDLGITPSGGLTWRVETVAGGAVIDNALTVSSVNLLDDSYHQVAAVYDGNTMEIYSDAILAGSQSAVGPIAKVPTETMLGGSLEDGTPSYFLNGRLDEVKIFGRALSAAEIRSIYLSGAGGHCRPGPPAVTVVQPSRDAVNVPINQRISATFDMAMDPSTINSGSFQLNNGVTGDVTYDPATRTAILIPFAELTPSTLYTAKITTGAKNLLGAGPASDYVWSFVTGAVPDTTPPVVISTSPLPGTADVATTSSITATFSEPMTASMINQTTFSLLRPNNTEVTGTVVYDPTTVTVRFTPDQPLDQDAVYTAVLGAGIEDAMGNPMTSSYEWTFSTGRPFTTSASIANPMGAGSITIRTSAGEIGEASGSDAASHAGMPLGLRFPYGLVGFQIAGLNPGDTTTITITFPENLSTDAAWFWVDPDLADWIDITGHVRWSGTTASWEITDGDVGDSDGIADGIITDPVGPALDSSQASPGPPTQSGNSGRNCFIATAAYGSYLDAHVRVLREFRDRYLLTNGLGRRFVECYYRSSPPLAELIRRHIVLKTATRWTLTPLVFMIEFPKTGLLVIVAGLMVWRKVRQKGTGRGWITSRNSSSS